MLKVSSCLKSTIYTWNFRRSCGQDLLGIAQIPVTTGGFEVQTSNIQCTNTAWKVSKYEVLSGPYFPVFTQCKVTQWVCGLQICIACKRFIIQTFLELLEFVVLNESRIRYHLSFKLRSSLNYLNFSISHFSL